MAIVKSEIALLHESLERLFAGRDGMLAAFAPDGRLIHANASALARLAGASTLSAFGLETLAATALETGSARGTGNLGGIPIALAAERLDIDRERVLLVTLAQPGETARPATAPAAPAPAVEASGTDATKTDTPTIEAATREPSSAGAPEIAPVVAAPGDEPATIKAPEAPPALPDESAGAEETLHPAAIEAAEPQPTEIPPPAEPHKAEAAASPAAATPEPGRAPPAERRHPLRFVWHLDADERFGIASDEFLELAGARTAAALGQPWSAVAAALALDPRYEVTRAIESRETWSGLVVSWPVDEADERLPVEMSGLPIFDRDRAFRGYRGFGVCRDVDRINELAKARRERPAAPTAPSPPAPVPGNAQPTAAPTPLAEPVDSPMAANVVPFRATASAEPKSAPVETRSPPALSPVERRAFRELAQELTARLREPQDEPAPDAGLEPLPPSERAIEAAAPSGTDAEQALLDRIPVGVLVYRHDKLLFANRHFLEWSGYESLAAIEAAGGLPRLFAEPDTLAPGGPPPAMASLSIVTQRGETVPVEGRMFAVPWSGAPALALIATNGQGAAARRDAVQGTAATQAEKRELRALLDAAADGIVTLDRDGRVVETNARTAALFGKRVGDLTGVRFEELLTPDCKNAAHDYFERVLQGAAISDIGLEVWAPGREGRPVALAMTLGRAGETLLAALRDVTARKESEDLLRSARREAARAASAKAEFLAKVSHEIRTPLNAITGFADVIMAERFGRIGNDRYRDYIKDIHGAGTQIAAMLGDLLDLSRAEAGQIELNFTDVNLNDLTQQCVGLMQPEANRGRIIIRTALTPSLPPVVADERSLRQIVINLITNSIKSTGPGGQVIVSTVFSDSREAILRVRDTGAGMSEADIATALEPFAHNAISGSRGSGGSGFGLPLIKALAEANRANFSIKSAPNAGTLVEIAFPPSRIALG